MSEMYRVTYLAHKQSHASYPGGFIKKNGRMNNSPAYNHAYYDDNKEKWPEYPSQQYKPMGNGKPSNIPPKADKKTGSSTSTSNANSNKPALSPLQQKARDEKLKYQNALKEKNLKDKAAKEAAAKAEAEKKAKQAATAASGSGKKGSSGGKGKKGKSDEEKAAEKAAKEQEKAEKKAAKTSEKGKKGSSGSKSKSESSKKSIDNSNTTTKLAAKKKDPIDEDETLSEREKKMYKGIRNVAEKSGQSIATYLQNENLDSIISQYFPGEIDPDEKKVIRKKLMERYKLEHGEASIGEYYAVTYSDELSHFGVKGMKWGVRRYENYDGSLTQRGLKRYRKTEANYNYSKNKYKTKKAEYKQGTATKWDVANAKKEMRDDKRTMKKYYKQLHNDKMADKGKLRYAQGERISTRGKIFGSIATGSAIAAGIFARTGNLDLTKKAIVVSAGSAAVYGLINAYAELPMGNNAQLRAYYSHKSLPDVKEKGTSHK